jgi:hypothetical protein
MHRTRQWSGVVLSEMAVQTEVSVVRGGASCGQAAVFVDDSYLTL